MEPGTGGWESDIPLANPQPILPLCGFLLQVRSLESKNKLLEDEIYALRSRFLQPSGLRQLYETQLKDLTRVAEQMRVQRVSSIAVRVHRCEGPSPATQMVTRGSPRLSGLT